MPVNYKESTIDGVKWERCGEFHGSNTYNGMPTVSFINATVMLDNDRLIELSRRTLRTDMSNPAKLIPMRNPETDEIVGQLDYQTFFVACYSLNRLLQEEADAQ